MSSIVTNRNQVDVRSEENKLDHESLPERTLAELTLESASAIRQDFFGASASASPLLECSIQSPPETNSAKEAPALSPKQDALIKRMLNDLPSEEAKTLLQAAFTATTGPDNGLLTKSRPDKYSILDCLEIIYEQPLVEALEGKRIELLDSTIKELYDSSELNFMFNSCVPATVQYCLLSSEPANYAYSIASLATAGLVITPNNQMVKLDYQGLEGVNGDSRSLSERMFQISLMSAMVQAYGSNYDYPSDTWIQEGEEVSGMYSLGLTFAMNLFEINQQKHMNIAFQDPGMHTELMEMIEQKVSQGMAIPASIVTFSNETEYGHVVPVIDIRTDNDGTKYVYFRETSGARGHEVGHCYMVYDERDNNQRIIESELVNAVDRIERIPYDDFLDLLYAAVIPIDTPQEQAMLQKLLDSVPN